ENLWRRKKERPPRGGERFWKRNPNPRTPNLEEGDPTGPEMAASAVEKLKALWNSQVNDEEQWALNYKLLKAAGLFAGSIFLMRNFGDLMAI
ncbi:unnamed protein product, partial [Urochloa humidicola]